MSTREAGVPQCGGNIVRSWRLNVRYFNAQAGRCSAHWTRRCTGTAGGLVAPGQSRIGRIHRGPGRGRRALPFRHSCRSSSRFRPAWGKLPGGLIYPRISTTEQWRAPGSRRQRTWQVRGERRRHRADAVCCVLGRQIEAGLQCSQVPSRTGSPTRSRPIAD